MKRILLAGGRSPSALELARLFRAAGHQVSVAETTRWCLCAVSRSVERFYRLPWPTVDPDGYVDELVRIVRHDDIDILIPTFEEVFHVAAALDRLSPHCDVFVDHLDSLHRLHSKWEFIRCIEALGLPVPRTLLLTGPEDIEAAAQQLDRAVFKPVYSRFSARTLICPPSLDKLRKFDIGPADPWVAQEFVPGPQICTYSVVHRGRITAHSAYPTEFRAGKGTAVSFRSVEHRPAYEWVEQVVGELRYHGQIGFDFIEREDGSLWPIECNPRTTSGVHLFGDTPGLVDALLDPATPTCTPRGGADSMLALPMLAALGVPREKRPGDWHETFAASRDVTFQREDPLPLLMQFVGLAWMYYRSVRYGTSIEEAGTMDLHWEGQAEAPLSES